MNFPENFAFLTALERASAQCAASPLKLRPEIADAIDYSSTDLLWLREKFGVSFSGLDYNAIGSRAPFLIPNTGITVEEICDVDAASYHRLLMHTAYILAYRASRPPQKQSG